jgi:hypothetical protein
MCRPDESRHYHHGPRKGEAVSSCSPSKERLGATMGSVLTFPSRGAHVEPQVLPYGAWLTDARLSSLGFSAKDIRAIRRGEPGVGCSGARRPFGSLEIEDDADAASR